MSLMRPAAYVFAIIGILITVPFAANAGAHGIVVAILGGTLAATPYVIVRALEEVLADSAGRQTSAPRHFTAGGDRCRGPIGANAVDL